MCVPPLKCYTPQPQIIQRYHRFDYLWLILFYPTSLWFLKEKILIFYYLICIRLWLDSKAGSDNGEKSRSFNRCNGLITIKKHQEEVHIILSRKHLTGRQVTNTVYKTEKVSKGQKLHTWLDKNRTDPKECWHYPPSHGRLQRVHDHDHANAAGESPCRWKSGSTMLWGPTTYPQRYRIDNFWHKSWS